MSNELTFEKIIVNGRAKWLSNMGDLLPYVAGGADGDEDPPKPPEPKPGDPPPKTFSQEEFNDIIKKRLDGARATSQADLMKELGITDPAEAKALIAKAKADEEANATELDKARRAAADHETTSARTTAELESSRLTTTIEKALIKAGLTVETAERVRRLVDVQKNDDEEIKTAIESLKTDMPSLFATEGAGVIPGSNPGGPPPGGQGKPNDPQAVAMRTLHERHPQLKKS